MSNTPQTIRRATADDVPAILALIRELAEYEKLLDACIATESLLLEHLLGSSAAAESMVALVDGKVVGYAIYFRTFSTFLAVPGLYLEDIYVQPTHRGGGLGKAMLVEICRIARQRGYGRVEWSVLKWNTPSIGFYESLGAVCMNEWQVYRLTGDALSKVAGQDVSSPQ